MAGAALGLTLLSTGLSMAQQYQQGRSEKAAYEAQARADENNARAVALETSINEDTVRRQNRQKLAAIRAEQSQAGLVGGTATGSYLQSFLNAERDALNLRYRGNSQWQNYMNSASLNRAYGKNAWRNAKWGIAATGVTGAAKSFFAGANTGLFGDKLQKALNGAE